MIDIDQIPKFYQGYVLQLDDEAVTDTLKSTKKVFEELINTIPESKGDYTYGEGKWSIKEVVQHIIDAERVFAYRILRFARNDKTDLSGFDQDKYVPVSKANRRSLQSLLEEFTHVRNSTIALFESFDDEMLQGTGTANGYSFTAGAVGYITSGHCLHHAQIIKERYLNGH